MLPGVVPYEWHLLLVVDEVTGPAVAELKRIEETLEERNALAYALWL